MTLPEIKAQFGTREVWRNKQESHPIGTIKAEGITIESYGELMPKMARALIAAGKPPEQLLSAYRGSMECLLPLTLEKWASGKAGKGEQPEGLKRARERKAQS